MKRILSAMLFLAMFFSSLPLLPSTKGYSQEPLPVDEIPAEYVEFPELVPSQSPDETAQLSQPELETA